MSPHTVRDGKSQSSPRRCELTRSGDAAVQRRRVTSMFLVAIGIVFDASVLAAAVGGGLTHSFPHKCE